MTVEREDEYNFHALSALCQFMIVSAIEEHDDEFLHSQYGDWVISCATHYHQCSKDSIYNASGVYRPSKKKWDKKSIIEDAKHLTLQELSEKYGVRLEKMRIWLSKRNIKWYGKREYGGK